MASLAGILGSAAKYTQGRVMQERMMQLGKDLHLMQVQQAPPFLIIPMRMATFCFGTTQAY